MHTYGLLKQATKATQPIKDTYNATRAGSGEIRAVAQVLETLEMLARLAAGDPRRDCPRPYLGHRGGDSAPTATDQEVTMSTNFEFFEGVLPASVRS